MITINQKPTAPETTVRQHARSIVDDNRNDICHCWHRNDLCGVHYVALRADSDSIHDIAYSAYRAAAQAYGYTNIDDCARSR